VGVSALLASRARALNFDFSVLHEVIKVVLVDFGIVVMILIKSFMMCNPSSPAGSPLQGEKSDI
jgi:hypothetical protein